LNSGGIKKIQIMLYNVHVFRYFISKGAIVDKIGGDLKSTPLHWATR